MDSLKLVNDMAGISSLVAKQNKELKQELAKLKERNGKYFHALIHFI